jgi:hypothetical protein
MLKNVEENDDSLSSGSLYHHHDESMMTRVWPTEMLHLVTVTVSHWLLVEVAVEAMVEAEGVVDVDLGLQYQRKIIQALRYISLQTPHYGLHNNAFLTAFTRTSI